VSDTTPVTPDLDEAARLVAEWRARGLYLERRGPDRLRIGPPDLLDDRVLDRAREAKPALLQILRERRSWPCARCGRFHFPLPTVCYWCKDTERSPAHA